MRSSDGVPASPATTASALALDLGSSSVRAVLGVLEDGAVRTQEVHRVTHQVVERDGHLTWQIETILEAVRHSLAEATRLLGHPPTSVGVDTWGVDYGLLDHQGRLLRAPRAYRDPRMSRWAAALEERLPRAQAWRATGVSPAEINTVYQLFADLLQEPGLLEQVATVLPLPDLVAHSLGGSLAAGRAIASTTGLAVPGAASWSPEVLEATGIPRHWLPEIVADGTVCGTTADGVAIVRPGGHDTACAVHALGLAPTDTSLFISCGSWSLIGATVPEPVVTDAAFAAGLTNEVRTDGGVRLLRNLTGFWLLQECQRSWGQDDTGALVEAARQAPSLGVVVDPDDPAFARPGDMPEKLATWCQEHYGLAPCGPGQTVRLILESLACAHAAYAEQLSRVLGPALAADAPVHLVGGGARNTLLAQMTASACGRQVVVGATEASALGNLLSQLEATGAIAPGQRAQVVARTVRPHTVEPADPEALNLMQERLLDAVG